MRVDSLRTPEPMPLFVEPAVELTQAMATVRVDSLSALHAFDLIRASKSKFAT